MCKRFSSTATSDFGEADFEWTVGLNRYCLKTIGVWPDNDVNQKFGLNDVQVILIIMLMTLGVIAPQLYALTMVLHELPLFVDNMVASVAMATATTKLVLLWLNKKRLKSILAFIKLDCLRWKDEWERDIMLTLAKRGRFLTTCGYVLMAFSVIGLMCGPFFGLSYRAINNITDRGDRFLPSQTYYPYDVTKTPYYELAYLAQVVGISFASVCFTSPVMLFGAVVFHNCGQLAILAVKMRNLKQNFEMPLVEFRRTVGRSLKDMVISHSSVIRNVNAIENSFTNLILAQTIGLSMMICCLGFQIMNALDSTAASPRISQLIVLGVTLSNVLMHTFVYSITGETLAFQSEEVHRSIYESEWYSFRTNHAMDLLLIMIRTREPLQLTAGKFLRLNLRTFTSILKTTAGYISMLIAVRDK